MEPEEAREISDRDQLWANLRLLRSEIETLVNASESLDDRQRVLAALVARIVLAELDFRAQDAASE